MSVRWLMGLMFIWVIAHGLLSGLMSGEYIGSDEAGIVNQMTYFDIISGQGIWGLPSLGFQFMKDLPNIISFNYPFLTGGYSVIRVIMGCVSIGIIWGLIQTFGPAFFGAISSIFRLGR